MLLEASSLYLRLDFFYQFSLIFATLGLIFELKALFLSQIYITIRWTHNDKAKHGVQNTLTAVKHSLKPFFRTHPTFKIKATLITQSTNIAVLPRDIKHTHFYLINRFFFLHFCFNRKEDALHWPHRHAQGRHPQRSSAFRRRGCWFLLLRWN